MTTQNAKVNQVIGVVSGWQAGRIGWGAVQFRADLSDRQMTCFAMLQRTTSRETVARMAASAVYGAEWSATNPYGIRESATA